MIESKLSYDDWNRLDKKFDAINEKIDGTGSRIHKIDLRVAHLEQGAVSVVSDAMRDHNDGSIMHNPIKAIGFWAVVLGAIEIIKKLWPRL